MLFFEKFFIQQSGKNIILYTLYYSIFFTWYCKYSLNSQLKEQGLYCTINFILYIITRSKCQTLKSTAAQIFFASLLFILPLRRGIYNCFPIPFIRGIRRLLNIKAQVSPVRAIGHQIERKMSGLQGCPLFNPRPPLPGQPFTLFLFPVPLITFLLAYVYWVYK